MNLRFGYILEIAQAALPMISKRNSWPMGDQTAPGARASTRVVGVFPLRGFLCGHTRPSLRRYVTLLTACHIA